MVDYIAVDVFVSIHSEFVAIDWLGSTPVSLHTARVAASLLSEKAGFYHFFLANVPFDPRDVGHVELIVVEGVEETPFPARCLFLLVVEGEACAVDHLFLRMDSFLAYCFFLFLSHH